MPRLPLAVVAPLAAQYSTAPRRPGRGVLWGNGQCDGGKFRPAYTFTGDGLQSVTSSTADVCTVTNGEVQFVDVGTCTLTAHIAEGVLYLAGDGPPQSFAVGKAQSFPVGK
jgi:hypothetical protein